MATLAVLGGLWVRWRTAVRSKLEPRWVAVGMLSLLCLAVAPSAMAGTLTNVSVTAGNYTVGATTADTFTYTTQTRVGAGDLLFTAIFPLGFTVPQFGLDVVTVTVNTVPKLPTFGGTNGGPLSIAFSIGQAVEAGSRISVTISNVVNSNATGTLQFDSLKTSRLGPPPTR